jgi:choline binding protein F
MKKKLLLSSVAALTLFAAYNTANAEFGTYGERLSEERKLPDANSIEKAQTPEELAEAATKYQARQDAALALRKANTSLTIAKSDEANADSVYEKAKKAYEDAVNKLKEAINTQYDASVQKDKLTAVLATVQARLDYDKKELEESLPLLDSLKGQQLTAATKLEAAEEKLQNHRDEKPVDGAPVDTLREYQLKHVELERQVEKAQDAKTLIDNEVKKAQKDVDDLHVAVQNGIDRVKSLNLAIAKLKAVVGNENPDSENTGEVRGVLVSELEKLKAHTLAELDKASDQRILSTSIRKEAEEVYNQKLAKAQEVYKAQGVEFVLADVLAVETSTETFVTKFGFNKDEAGNWVYVKDSEGNLAKGWVNENGSWYYLDPTTGVMQKWWVKVDGTWYFLNGSGAMQTGWLQDKGTWYYLEASGAMKASQWFEVDGKWYYVDGSGALAVNTTVDGYNVNENGEWV